MSAATPISDDVAAMLAALDAGTDDGEPWTRTDLATVLDGEHVRPAPAILARTSGGGAAFYLGKLNALHGASEGGKTWAALAAVSEVLTDGGAALWIEWEDDEATTVERLRSLGVPDGLIADGLLHVRPTGPPSPADVATVLDLAKEYGATLAVIDGVTEAMAAGGLDPNSGADVAEWVRQLPAPLAALGVAVVWVDHIRRGNDIGGDAIGSVHKRNVISGVAYEVRNVEPFAPGSGGMSRLIVTKDRPGAVRAMCSDSDRRAFADFRLSPIFDRPHGLAWSLTPSTHTPTADDEGRRPMREMERVCSALADLGPLNRRALRGAVIGKHDRIDLALAVLLDEGYIEVRTGPNREREHHLVTRYTATDDPKNPARGGA